MRASHLIFLVISMWFLQSCTSMNSLQGRYFSRDMIRGKQVIIEGYLNGNELYKSKEDLAKYDPRNCWSVSYHESITKSLAPFPRPRHLRAWAVSVGDPEQFRVPGEFVSLYVRGRGYGTYCEDKNVYWINSFMIIE